MPLPSSLPPMNSALRHGFAATLAAGFLATSLSAQTNTFPASGNVGIGTAAPGAKLDVAFVHGQYARHVLPAAVNGGGTGDAGLYTWISEPWWSWTGAGIGRNIYNSGTWGARVNPNLSAQMMQFREDPTIIFSIWDSSGTGYSPLTLNHGNAFFSGNVGIGTASPQARLQFGSLSDGTGEATNHGELLFAKQNTSLDTRGGIEWKIAADNYGAKIDTISAGGANIVFGLRNNSLTWIEALRINPSGNVGIGTSSPSGRLTISGAGGDGRSVTLDSREVKFRGDGISHMSIFGPTEGKPYLSIGDSSTNFLPGTPSTEAFVVHRTGNVGIGTTNPTNKLEVAGTIRAKEVIVETTGWSDYVFAPDYRLAPLSEVEAHIAAKGTLPGIPSAAEVATQGVSVGEMQAKLLAKIEELTLRQIAQEKRLDAQSAEIAALKAENTALMRSQP